MSFLQKLFTKKESPVTSYSSFWEWFTKNNDRFYEVIKTRKGIEKKFFDPLSEKLSQLKEGFFYLTGMYDDHTAELVLTADGDIKNIVFVEELVEAAPVIEHWKFTALKPALDKKNVSINMAGYSFQADNMFFYSNDADEYPDEIDIAVVHEETTEENKKEMSSGMYIFLDNFLGELNFVNTIDHLDIVPHKQATKPLIPIEKLKDFLIWREKEFVEKYEDTRYDTTLNERAIFEAPLKNGTKLIATINTELLDWDQKASHPWIAVMTIKYDGSKNNGMPAEDAYTAMNEIEERMILELIDKDGYLNIGRQTADGERDIYFACRDFRKPSKVMYAIQQAHANQFEMDYDIYKDKYWQSFERFRQV